MKSIHVTTDIYLAAAMLSLGARLDGVDKSDPRHMEFTIIAKDTKFESNNLPTPEPMDLESIEKQWVNGTLMINAVSFKDAIQRMKSVIHSK